MASRMYFRPHHLAGLGFCLGLTACVAYHPAPLPSTPPLAPLFVSSAPLTMAQVAALAVQRDPELAAARAQRGIARAELLSAGLLPDPSITGGFGALLGGPASMPSIAGGLTQDISALITYVPDKKAAKAGLAQVDAGILWQEWQVAAQAKQLCIALADERATLASLHADETALTQLNDEIQGQLAAHNLTETDAAASTTALAALQGALDTEEQTQSQDRAQLDELLGLTPGVDIPLAAPSVTQVPDAGVQQSIATLGTRRPDLIALRYGYTQADETLRAAIISQFLPVSLGATGGRDTSGVFSAGPQITLTLPIFNRNRPAIEAAEATRTALRAQFAASLASAISGAEVLVQNIALLRAQSEAADGTAAQAQAAAASARQAYGAGELDRRAATDLITAAGDREREAIALHTQLATAELSLVTMLGYGLPPMAEIDTGPTA